MCALGGKTLLHPKEREALAGPRVTFTLPGRRGNGDEDAALEVGTEEVAGEKEIGTPAPVASAPVAPTNTGHDTEWVFAQIERLGELKEKGLLTEEEFTAKKAELLDRI